MKWFKGKDTVTAVESGYHLYDTHVHDISDPGGKRHKYHVYQNVHKIALSTACMAVWGGGPSVAAKLCAFSPLSKTRCCLPAHNDALAESRNTATPRPGVVHDTDHKRGPWAAVGASKDVLAEPPHLGDKLDKHATPDMAQCSYRDHNPQLWPLVVTIKRLERGRRRSVWQEWLGLSGARAHLRVIPAGDVGIAYK